MSRSPSCTPGTAWGNALWYYRCVLHPLVRKVGGGVGFAVIVLLTYVGLRMLYFGSEGEGCADAEATTPTLAVWGQSCL
jgi:hypothetical protein